MSIKPPSDLLLDVAKAADPVASAAAAERLAKLAAQGGDMDAGFSQVLEGVGGPQVKPGAAADAAAARVNFRPSSPVDPKQKAYQGLEALLLQNLVETMLPKDSDLFGEGSAGMIWRSMLARELGADIAKKVDLGVEPSYLRSSHDKTAHRGKPAEASTASTSGIASVTSKHA